MAILWTHSITDYFQVNSKRSEWNILVQKFWKKQNNARTYLEMMVNDIYGNSLTVWNQDLGTVWQYGYSYSYRSRGLWKSICPLPLMLASSRPRGTSGVVIGQRIAHGRTYLSWGLTPGDVRIPDSMTDWISTKLSVELLQSCGKNSFKQSSRSIQSSVDCLFDHLLCKIDYRIMFWKRKVCTSFSRHNNIFMSYLDS